MLTHTNGGPRLRKGVTFRSVDYKGCGRSNPIYSEFHHITGAAFLFKAKGCSRLGTALAFFVNRRFFALLSYFTLATIALKASGWFMARSASTLRLISMPALCNRPINWE